LDDSNERFPNRPELLAIVIAGLGFTISYVSANWSTTNGIVTSFSYFDLSKLLLGLATLAMTLRNSVYISEGEAKHKTARIILTLALVAIGMIHILSAFGVFIDPQAYVNANR
jgi:hypothetical protein